MHERNMELSKEREGIKFRYDIITEDYVDVFGYKLQVSNLSADTSKVFSEFEAYFNKNFPEGIFSIDASQMILLCAIYECTGYSLKNQRRADRRFRNFSRKLDTYRIKVTDTKLNALIQLHIYTSDCCSDLFLIHKLPESDKQEFIQKLPQNWRVQFQNETMETLFKETMNDIRVKIGERIKEIENNGEAK